MWVGSQAADAYGQSEPDGSFGFHEFCKRAIIDQRGPNLGDAAGPLERAPLDQHAAAGGRSGFGRAAVYPGEGVEHLEEKDEGWDECALGEALAMELRHQR